jgi:PAS domain S-box-containing protein
MPQDLAERWETALRQVFKTGQEVCIEFVYTSPDGPRDYESRLFPERVQDGAIAAVFSIARDVTDRKRVEEALPESAARFRSLWEYSMDGILLTAPDGRILMASPAACRILGRSEEEICRIGRAGVVDQTDPQLPVLLEERARTGKCKGELRFIRPDGTTCPCEITSAVFTDRDGLSWTSMCIHDITERKQVEFALRESEERYRAVLEDQTEVICRFHADGKFIYVNDVFCRFFGKTKQELYGQKWQPKVVPDDLPLIEAKLRTLSSRNPVVRIENRIYSGTGEIHWMQFVNRGFFDSEGRLLEIQAVGRDITERRRAEEELRESEEMIRVTLSSILDPVFITDDDGRFTYICPNVPQLLGYSMEDLQAMGSITPFVGRDLLRHEELERQGEVKNIETAIRDGHGRQRIFLTNVKRVAIKGGTRLFTLHDITERKRAEEKLRENEAAARARADELATVLAATPALTFIAHDRDCRHMTCSLTALRLLRLPAEANTSKSAPPGERPETFRVMKDGRELRPEELPVQLAAATGQAVKNFELTFAFDDGTARDICGDAVPLFDTEGKVRGAVGAFLDITERKRAEEALRIASIYARSLIEVSLDPLVTIDAIGKITDVNVATEKATGVARQQLIGSDFAEYFTDPDKARSGYRRVFDQGNVVDYPLTIRHTSGRCMNVMYNASLFQNEQGKVVGVFATARDITQQKEAEGALRRNQAELKAIYDNVPIMMCVLNASRQVLYANRAFTEFVGRPLEELTLERACGVIGCLNALDDPRGCGYGPRCETCAVRLAMVDAMATGRTHRGIEYRITALRGGQPRDAVFLASVTPYEVLGKFNLLICLEDITERQWAEEVFRDLSHFNQEILDALPAHICVLDEGGKIVAVNRTWRNFAAANAPLPSAVDIGAEYFAVCDAATGDDAVMAHEAVRGLRAVGRGELSEFSFEYPCHSPDVQRWFLLRSMRLSRDSQPRIVVLHIDITERKQAEIAQHESEERYRMVVEDQTEIICRLRWDDTITFINHAFCRFLGKAQQEFLGQKWQPIAMADDLPMIEAKLRTLSPTHPVVLIENRIYSGTGGIRWMQFVNRGFFDCDGHLMEIQLVGRDITDRKLAEEALLMHTRQLEAIRAIGEEIIQELNLTALLQLITERSAVLMGAATGVVALWDEAAQILVPSAWFGPREHLKDLQWKPGEDLSGITESSTHTAVLTEPFLYGDRLVGVVRVDREANRQPFTEMDRQLLALFATQAAIAIENARLYEEVRTGRKQLQALSRRQLEVQEEERRTLARELHDEIGQLLTGLKLTLDMLTEEASDTGQSILRESQDLVGELIGRVRELSLNLRPALLDDLGLLAALLWQFERFTAHTRVRVNFVHAGLEGRPCRPEVETAAYRIVQEALTNIARHSGADEAQVRLCVEGGRLLVRIEDQGRGFEPTITLDPEESSGMVGMRERATLLGGHLHIESSPGAGTRIQAELPLAPGVRP